VHSCGTDPYAAGSPHWDHDDVDEVEIAAPITRTAAGALNNAHELESVVVPVESDGGGDISDGIY